MNNKSKSIMLAVSLMFVLISIGLAQDRVFPIKSSEYSTVDSEANFPFEAEGAIKWEEIFNDVVPPAGWQVIDNDGSGIAWEFRQDVSFTSGDTIFPQAGQSFWFSNYTNANVSGLIDEWLISPQLPLIEAGDSLRFYAGAIDGFFPDSLKVLVSTTNSVPSSFTEIAYFKVDGPIGAWNLYSFDLTPFAGSQIYVAVNYYIVDGGPSGNNSDNVWVDHFILEGQSTNARLQVIHNAADPAAATVDIYVNDSLFVDDFDFREATPFVDVPAGVTLNIGVAPGNSISAGDTLVNIPVVLAAGETYAAIANGVLDPSSFTANPDGRDIAFTLFARDDAQEAAMTSGNVEFAVLHGSTDAPTVDVVARNVATLVDNAAYGDFTGYISVPENDYILDVTDASGSNIVASYSAPLATLGLADSALVVFASGFLDPAANQNGPAFGLYAVLPGGGAAVELPPYLTGIGDEGSAVVKEFALEQNYPNPFNPSTTISFALPSAQDVTVTIFNLLGQEMRTVVNERFDAGVHRVNFDASDLVSGVYFYRIDAGQFSATKKMILMK